MALQKTFNLPNGATGNYIQVGPFTSDRVTKTASADFLLFASAAWAAAHPEAPLCVIARLALSGAKWEERLAESVLAELEDAGSNPVVHQFYEAAKAGEPLRAGGGLTQAEATLTDATDV